MNINPMIETAFKDFSVSSEVIPIAFMSYSGTETSYLTYYTWLEQPQSFYDDDYHSELVNGTIDIFSKGNFKSILDAVKTTLKQNGFMWTDNGPETYEDDTGYYHVPVNFYYLG